VLCTSFGCLWIPTIDKKVDKLITLPFRAPHPAGYDVTVAKYIAEFTGHPL
jgi:hypothetical protein